jgi:hypothetical protein
LNWDAESITIGRISIQCGSSAVAYIGGVGTHLPESLTLYRDAPREHCNYRLCSR